MSPERFRQLEELYHAAREGTPEERAALLSRIDPEMGGELEMLLFNARRGDFLDRPALQNAPELLDASGTAVVAPGTPVGPYRIEGKLGEGGMAEVFRACDTRLGRAVAIKITREPFSSRFDREARAIAALNHRNICQLYDVGSNYLVMELVEGPTLASRIESGAVPAEEAITIARQIGDALEAAHEKGIIHRDLKPANIKITSDGTVKVLDFGLAKITPWPAAPGITPEEAAVLPMEASRLGDIIGTAAYMAPEQARGKAVDKRADIWAFGVILYEMLAGRRLFQGETISDTVANVLTTEPDWERVPVKARRLLKTCLERDPKRRLRDIGDAWALLDDAPVTAYRSRMAWIPAGILAIITALALWSPWRSPEKTAQAPLPRIDLDLGADVSLAGDAGPAVVLSPDGRRMVFVSQDEHGVSRLFSRPLDQPRAAVLPGTDGAAGPFFSPDGQWIGFFARGALKKTRIDGGEPVYLCDAPQGRGASWGDDGKIVAALTGGGGLSLIPASGGNRIPATELAPGEACHRWPYFLPGGKFVLFTVSTLINNFDEAGIAVLSLQDHKRHLLLEHAGMYPRYLPTGYLTYVTSGSLFAAPFDVKRLQITGSATRLGEVAADIPRGFAQYDFAVAGILASRTHGGQGLSRPAWLDSAGRSEPLGLEVARYHYLRLSPDGGTLAYVSTQGPNSDLFLYDWRRSIKTRLTNGRVTRSPVWTPNGRFVVFAARGGMFAARTDGAGMPAQLTWSSSLQTPNTFSPDGRRLIFTEGGIAGERGETRVAPVDIENGQMVARKDESLFGRAGFPDFLSRWAMAGVFECGKRRFPSLRAGISRQRQTSAGLNNRWQPAVLVARRARAFLSQRRPADHGGEIRDPRRFIHSRETAPMVRQTYC